MDNFYGRLNPTQTPSDLQCPQNFILPAIQKPCEIGQYALSKIVCSDFKFAPEVCLLQSILSMSILEVMVVMVMVVLLSILSMSIVHPGGNGGNAFAKHIVLVYPGGILVMVMVMMVLQSILSMSRR